MESKKITTALERGVRRRYLDACATAHALDLVGERWALLVVRELMTGPKRFSDLRAGLPGISANVLTQRLEGLEAIGVVQRRTLPPPAASKVYELTEWGYQSEPIFQAMGRWAARSPHHDPTLPFSAASLVLSLRTMFDASRAAGLTGEVGFRLGAETYRARVAGGSFAIEAAPVEDADVVFSGAPPALAAVIYGGQTLTALEAAGAITVEGDRTLAERFVTLFPLPDKAAPPA
jgi:DNA-binding HxlR family transcriptional regulator